MKNLKADFIASIKNKRLNVFLLFLVSAFIILFFSKLSKSYTNTLTFNINKINVPQDKVILNDSSHTLKITLKTHGFKWFMYYVSKPKITIDFSNEVYQKKKSFVYAKSISYLNEKQPFKHEVKILSINPDTLVLYYDTHLVKTVPVKVKANINFAPGYDILNSYHTIPDSVTVIGPNNLVSSINNISTEEVNLQNVKSDIDTKVKLLLPEKTKDLTFSVKTVDFKADIEKFTEGKLKIPVSIINLPEEVSIKYFPKELTVSFYTSLQEFNKVSAKDFKIVCDYKLINKQQSFLIPELVKQPKSIKRVKLNQKHIEFIILE